jgi:bifunctional non-homologous end joining protein LigD
MPTKKSAHISVQLTNTDRILFPTSNITKGALITYYLKIAPVILPYLKDRPISMHRYPNGIGQEGFYQKNAGDYFPAWISTKGIKKEDKTVVNYVLVNSAPTLAYLANQACITMHPWLSKVDELNYPDRMIFDLDPSHKAVKFADVAQTAIALRLLLHQLGLPAFVMLTGSHGIHVYVPLKRTATFDVVRHFAHEVATYLVAHNPQLLTMEIRKNRRGKRIFIDTLRNAYGATGVAPYAVRAHEGAPVATPLAWDELDDKKLTSQAYTIATIFKRLKKMGDPWQHMMKQAVTLGKARKVLDGLSKNL